MTVEHLHGVPHLTTALSGPLHHIESVLLKHQSRIESWLREQWSTYPAAFYTSVDLRNAGFKLAPVDTNLFPAGFNNLNTAFNSLCIQAIQTTIEHLCPKAAGILIIPENHTRNLFYLESLATLYEFISKAGFSVHIGSLDAELKEKRQIDLPSGKKVTLNPLIRKDNKVGIEGFDPCMVLLNNDLSAGQPEILKGLDQMVTPPLDLGWSNRLKSTHFGHYRDLARDFCKLVDLDPWLIDPLFRNCGKLDFKKREGENCLVQNSEKLLTAIQKKYDEYEIKEKPFIIVKADAGTYGMGIMTIHSPDEIAGLNRKQRNKMSSAKDGMDVSQVILQEGVYTFETWQDANSVAEPVVYMIDRYVVGGFYRVHTERGPTENLNAPGMHFQPLAFIEPCNIPNPDMAPDAEPNRFYAYGVIARLAQIAAAREIAYSRALSLQT